MYETFYHMVHTPFSRNIPPEALYESRAMTDCLGRLSYVADRQLFAVVTADAGCGLILNNQDLFILPRF